LRDIRKPRIHIGLAPYKVVVLLGNALVDELAGCVVDGTKLAARNLRLKPCLLFWCQ
jgi:hypothetical protein